LPSSGWRPWAPGASVSTPGLDRVSGHRGAKARAPENTLAGLREARRLGCGWVEFDVMLSRDGVPVLIHDETVDRTTDGRGRVADLTLAELRSLDASAGFGASFGGERIPTLAEAIAACLDLGLAANVEIKPSSGHAAETGRVVARTLREAWPTAGPPVLLSSFERAALAAARDTAPAIPRGLLADSLPADWETAVQELRCATLHLDHTRATPAGLRDLVARGALVLLDTVNEPARARELLDAGASAVFTDVPDTILAALG
jgi:glycerophosphoryl diester phosphodiesterase